MKNSIFIFLLIFCVFYSLNASNSICSISTSNIINSSSDIDDGWYQAKVKYSNFATGTNSTYKLNVYVQYDKVTKIDFGNGGSVHNGYNNEGYIYSEGILYFDSDYNGNISSATATVTITEQNWSTHTYKITIE